MFTLRSQNLIWTGGYGLLIVLIAACARADAALARNGSGRYRYRGHRRAGAAVDPARALDLSRRGAVGPADRGDRAYFHRRRRGAAAVGAAAVAVSVDLGAGVPVASAAAAQMDAAAAAAGDRRRHRAAGVRRRAEPAADARRPSVVLLRHRDGLPWRIGADPPGREISHRLLCRAVVRRHGRRPVRRIDRAVHVLLDRRISDPAGLRGAVPAARRPRAVRALEPLVLAVSRRAGGGADRADLRHRQDIHLARNQPRLGDRRGRRALGVAGARVERQPLEDLCHRRGGAGADPGLSVGRRTGGNRAQLFRGPQDRGDAARPVSRADARHHDSRRREIPERRRHAGARDGPSRSPTTTRTAASVRRSRRCASARAARCASR